MGVNRRGSHKRRGLLHGRLHGFFLGTLDDLPTGSLQGGHQPPAAGKPGAGEPRQPGPSRNLQPNTTAHLGGRTKHVLAEQTPLPQVQKHYAAHNGLNGATRSLT